MESPTTPAPLPPTALVVEPVTINDIPALSELWYKAFSIPANLRMFPDTPSVRAWWDDANRQDLLHSPYRKYLKVVDPTVPGSLIAYAKWDLAPEESGKRFPPWHPESDHEACEHLFTRLEEERRRFLGNRKYYYLDMLVAHPDYRRRGAGSLLIQWGCNRADQNGVVAYLDAHIDAAPLYRKFGFREREDIGVTSEGAVPMVREPAAQA